ncbi:MAG: wax ester/triacylglycerol synthase domain-containing protein [Microthrixaceae bacterium]
MSETSSEQQHMSGFESLMWEMERDPQLSSTFANLSVFDQVLDRSAFRKRMEQAIVNVPRLSQRVVTSLTPWELPRWVDDPEIDLDHHLRWMDLGGNATRKDLYELVATLSRQPFDRERPLWEFVTIEGLEGGRSAMLQRLHHTITDGEGGIVLSVEFLDFERVPTLRPRRTRSATLSQEESGIAQEESGIAPSESPKPWWSKASAPFVSAASGAASLPARTADLASAVRSAARQARVGQRCSPLWTERSLGRWFGTTTLHLEDVLSAAHLLGGSVNDFFIAGAAEAAGELHYQAGHEVEQLRVSMPVSTRHDRSAGGNAFSPTQMLVPTARMEPAERLAEIHKIVANVRSERAIESMGTAAQAAAMLPSAAILRSGQHLAHSVDFVCSNVRAAPFELFIGGALMQANYPIGPLAGTAFNLTTMSYRGWLFLGLAVDPAAVSQPQELLDQLENAYDRLFESVGLKRQQPDAF